MCVCVCVCRGREGQREAPEGRTFFSFFLAFRIGLVARIALMDEGTAGVRAALPAGTVMQQI